MIARQDGVLLSGATGFVGAAVLARYLDQTDRPVFALVRARTAADADARLRAVLHELYDPTTAQRHGARCTAVAADLERPRLGLGPGDREQIARACSEVVHCAASVSFDLPLPEARAINTSGVRRVAPARRAVRGPRRGPRPLRPRVDGLRRGQPRRRVRRGRRALRRGLSQHLRADEVRGRAAVAAVAEAAAAADPAPEHRRRLAAIGLDARVQRPVLAVADVLARAAAGHPGARAVAGRRRAGRLRRRLDPGAGRRAPPGTYHLVAGEHATTVGRRDRPGGAALRRGPAAPARSRHTSRSRRSTTTA